MIFTLDSTYSTTRLVSIIAPKIEEHPESKFQTHIFLPEGEGRQGEGGFRTKGYFKHSYEIIDGQWYITDNFGISEDDAQKIPIDVSQVPDDLLEYVQNELRHADEDSSKDTEKNYLGKYIKLPLITVITVVFNGEKYLTETIESVINQTYPNVEYIIVDGRSTDDTLDIIKNYEKLIDYWVSEKDEGIYDAMNKGIITSQGEIVGIVNSDDFYEIDTCKLVAKTFKENPYVYLIHGSMRTIDEKGKIDSVYGNKENFSEVLTAPFNHPACFFHIKFYRRYGLFDKKYSTAADYDLMLRFKRMNLNDLYIDIILSNFRKQGITSQSKFFPAGQIWSLLRKNGYSYQKCIYAIGYRIFRIILSQVLSILGLNSLKIKLRQKINYHKLNN